MRLGLFHAEVCFGTFARFVPCVFFGSKEAGTSLSTAEAKHKCSVLHRHSHCTD